MSIRDIPIATLVEVTRDALQNHQDSKELEVAILCLTEIKVGQEEVEKQWSFVE